MLFMLSPKCVTWLVCLQPDNTAVLFMATNGWEKAQKGGTLHYIKVATKSERAAVFLIHRGQKISCFPLSAYLSECLFGFCLKTQRGGIENSQSGIYGHCISSWKSEICMLALWSSKYTQAEHVDGPGVKNDTREPGQASFIFDFLNAL